MTVLSWLTAIMGVLMSFSHFPQAYKIWKRKSSKDISLIMYSIGTLGAYIWFAYGVSIMDWPIIVSFGVAMVGTTTALLLTLKYK
jgi:MtN3 and saliva related transmembrane protein